MSRKSEGARDSGGPLLSVGEVLRLQRQAGNQAVLRLLRRDRRSRDAAVKPEVPGQEGVGQADERTSLGATE